MTGSAFFILMTKINQDVISFYDLLLRKFFTANYSLVYMRYNEIRVTTETPDKEEPNSVD